MNKKTRTLTVEEIDNGFLVILNETVDGGYDYASSYKQVKRYAPSVGHIGSVIESFYTE